ncbi:MULTISPECIES: hypothetical protein [Pseudomonas syringae group]|uniref:hypothetical protein n=1 Tax=Pseudomonas syringae group TaxID=136849 RepID=UPI000F01CCE1|nr:hypothetical protein [Pseudomonas viridiflava]MCF8977517.1 hypothetical protein [Pseudomonas syringae]
MVTKKKTSKKPALLSKPFPPFIGELPDVVLKSVGVEVDLDAKATPAGVSGAIYNMAGGPLRVSVTAGTSSAYDHLPFVSGDKVTLELSAGGGSGVIWSDSFTARFRYIHDPRGTYSGDYRTFYISADEVKAYAGKKLALTCSAQSPGGKLRVSSPLEFLIRGLPVSDEDAATTPEQSSVALPGPVVLEAISDTVDPDNLSSRGELKYITVAIDYPMELDDIVRLSMTGRDVDQNEIVFTDRDRPISESNLARRPLTITFLEEQIKPLIGGVIVLSYQVARKGVWQSSPVKVISIGPSLAGLPPFINEVKDGRLDPGLIAQSIDVHIPSAGTRVGDRITLYWNDSSRKRPFRDKATVTQLNVDGDLSFDVYVDEVIQFNRGKIVTLFYTIERGSEGGSKATYRSGDYRFFVGSEQEQRTAGSAISVAPKVSGLSAGAVDPSLVDAGVGVTVPFSDTQEGDSVTAFWQTGSETPSPIGTVLVDASNVDTDLSFMAPAEVAKAALNKKVSVYYVITRKWTGTAEQKIRSREVMFSVGVIAASGALPAPEISHAEYDVLDPMDVLDGETVVVRPYPTIAIGDRVRLFWVGMEGAGTPELPEQVVSDVSKPLIFTIPSSAIGWSMGADVWVYYQVSRNGVAKPMESEPSVIEVEMLGYDHLSTPVADQASGGLLDLSEISTHITFSLKAWPFIQAKQRIWFSLEGVDKNDAPWKVYLWIARRVTAQEVSQGLKAKIPYHRFGSVEDGSKINVYASVTYDGDFSEKYADKFPVLTLTVRQPTPVAPAQLSILPLNMTLTAAYPPQGSTPVGEAAQLKPIGGTKPYRFKSDDPSVVHVSELGVVKAVSNGDAVVSIHDATGAKVDVSIYVEGFPELYMLDRDTYEECEAWAKEDGLTIPALSDLRRVCTDPGRPMDFSDVSPPILWASDTDQDQTYRTLYLPLEDVARIVDRYSADLMTAYGSVIVFQAQYEDEDEDGEEKSSALI